MNRIGLLRALSGCGARSSMGHRLQGNPMYASGFRTSLRS